MALPNDRNQFQKRGGQGKPKPQSKGPEPVKVEEVPENYVEQAENVMYDLVIGDPLPPPKFGTYSA